MSQSFFQKDYLTRYDGGLHHMEILNQWTVFYIIESSIMKELTSVSRVMRVMSQHAPLRTFNQVQKKQPEFQIGFVIKPQNIPLQIYSANLSSFILRNLESNRQGPLNILSFLPSIKCMFCENLVEIRLDYCKRFP